MYIWVEEDTYTCANKHTHIHTHTHTVAIIPEFHMVNPCAGEALHDNHMGVHMGGGGHMFGLQMSYFEATVRPPCVFVDGRRSCYYYYYYYIIIL